MVRVEEKDLFSPEREDNIFIVFPSSQMNTFIVLELRY